MQDDAGVVPGVGGDLAQRRLQSGLDDPNARLFVTGQLQVVQSRDTPDQGNAPARNDPFLDRRPRCVQRVFDPGLLLFQLRFRGGADVDLRNTAGELRPPLFKLFTIIVRRGRVNLSRNLLDPSLDVGRRTGAFDNRRVVGVDPDLLRLTQILDGDVFQVDSEVFHNGGRAGQNGDILEHRLPSVTVPRRLDRANLENAP